MKQKITQDFDVKVEVAEPNCRWLWLQINTADFTADDENKYQIKFGPDISLKTADGKVIVSVPIVDLLNQMAEIAKKAG